MNIQKKISVLLSVALVLSLLVTGCSKPDIVVETEAPSVQETPAQGVDTVDPSASISDPSNAQSVTQMTQPVSNQPTETGAEPDPQSAFAKLTKEQQEQVISWLSTFGTSLNGVQEIMNSFASQVAGALAPLKESQGTLNQSELYNAFKTTIDQQLEGILAIDTTQFPQSTASLTESGKSVLQWIQQFVLDLGAQSSADTKALGTWMDGKTEELRNLMQGFLDILSQLKS